MASNSDPSTGHDQYAEHQYAEHQYAEDEDTEEQFSEDEYTEEEDSGDEDAEEQHAEEQHAEEQHAEEQRAKELDAKDENSSPPDDPKDGDYNGSNSTKKVPRKKRAQKGESSQGQKDGGPTDSLFYCPLCKQHFEQLKRIIDPEKGHWHKVHANPQEPEILLTAEQSIVASYNGLSEDEKGARTCSPIFEKEKIRRRLAAEKHPDSEARKARNAIVKKGWEDVQDERKAGDRTAVYTAPEKIVDSDDS